MTARVSICIPNLNTRPFLPERFETIFSQSFEDWELLVYDSHSDDGSWEYIQDLARREKRMRVWQGPREGTPVSWNPCIREARGEFVYIATSDDTMAPDCLEKMVAALDEHQECDLAHCTLVPIDSQGARATSWRWPDITAFGGEEPDLTCHRHVRRAPYDGLLHLTGRMVYLSITELLIRRILFAKIGLFPARWRSHGDRNWDMRAGLVASTVHVPDTWASWRLHASQATNASGDYESLAHFQMVHDMLQDAVLACESQLPPAVAAGLKNHWLDWTRDMRLYYRELNLRRDSFIERKLFQASRVVAGKPAERRELMARLQGRPTWPERVAYEMRHWLESLGLGPVVTKI